VQLVDQPFVKIGSTTQLSIRLSCLQISSPYEVKLLGLVPESEEELQTRFQHLLCRGEWYHLRDELSSFIDRIAAK